MSAEGPYILGLDLGANSLGWALVRLERGKPAGLMRAGVRVFEAGVEGNFESGRAESRAAARRRARQQRRLTERRARRKRKLFHLLQRTGLLPEGDARTVLPDFDATLREKHLSQADDRDRLAHVLPYMLRARALDEPLEPHELGRALYHLGQRRGFASNRRRPAQENEDEGPVKEGIADLAKQMAEAGARTLGQYFAGLDPREERIRGRWTSRAMYEAEFDAIWTAQQPYHSERLTAELKQAVRKAIFHQRPLSSAKGLVGPCQLEPGKRRAPWSLPLAQRFRLLQQVGNTLIQGPDGTERPVTGDERDTLIEHLDREGDFSFTQAKKLLGLSPRHKFKWESGGEKRFVGNRTNAKLGAVFGDRWWRLPESDREGILQDLWSIQKKHVLEARGRERWALAPEAAARLAETQLEPGYCHLSRRALAKLVPCLEDGLPYATAVKEVYGEFHGRSEPLDRLPPLDAPLPHLTNPAVHRALTELRQVVNAIVRRYGKPEAVRVELARDMRRSRKQRQEAWKRNRRNERRREEAAAKVLAETGKEKPGRADVEKVLLAEECGWHCPYTGRAISMRALVGPEPQFDVEHIVPFSRSLDNSFLNKTLCYHEENRSRKKNRTPAEAYGSDGERFEEILARVAAFKGDAAKEKLRRFQLGPEDLEDLNEFASRQLGDTRYAAREAMQYLGLLYGGLFDETRRRVEAVRGGVTAYLRAGWHLNSILGDGPGKSRNDHRHHAVDAVVVALTDAGTIKMLSDAAERAQAEGRRAFGDVEDPWVGFFDEGHQAVDAIQVSHRPKRKVNARLHEDTLYSPPKVDPQGKPCVHVRKPLDALSKKDVPSIVDPVVREQVRASLEAAERDDPAKAFADPRNHPSMPDSGIAIHRVRVRRSTATFAVGEGREARHVSTDSNHHVEVLEITKGKKSGTWTGSVVTTYDAVRRLANHEPVVRKDHGGDREFRFSLASGDTIQLEDEDGTPGLFVVRTVSQSKGGGINIEFADAKDARPKKDIKASGDWLKRSIDRLRQLHCRKVTVTPLGDVRWAND